MLFWAPKYISGGKNMVKEVVITSGVRTPIGSFGGALMNISGPDLGAMVVKDFARHFEVWLI